MTDYISRKAAIDCLYSTMESYYIKRNIMDLPAADVRPVVHGRWEDRGSLSARCSECGCKSLRASDFCPNCGADMREENDVQTDFKTSH